MGDMNIRDVPDDLKKNFRALCILQGKTLRDGIIDLMKREVEKEQKGKL